VVQLRTELLAVAGSAFPALGRDILPRTLQPLQEHRCTASELEQALLGMKYAPPLPPAADEPTVTDTADGASVGDGSSTAETVSRLGTFVPEQLTSLNVMRLVVTP
jgi:hypothetical protein